MSNPWIESANTARAQPIAWLIQAVALKRAVVVLWTVFSDEMQRVRVDHPEGGFLPGRGLIDYGRPYSYPDHSLYPTLMMLEGLAIENQLKSIAPDHRGHDLVKLCRRTGVDVTNDEADLLDRLTLFILWAGRYPAPLASSPEQAVPPRQRVTPRWLPPPFYWDDRDHTQFLALYHRLWRVLAGHIPALAAMGDNLPD